LGGGRGKGISWGEKRIRLSHAQNPGWGLAPAGFFLRQKNKAKKKEFFPPGAGGGIQKRGTNGEGCKKNKKKKKGGGNKVKKKKKKKKKKGVQKGGKTQGWGGSPGGEGQGEVIGPN